MKTLFKYVLLVVLLNGMCWAQTTKKELPKASKECEQLIEQQLLKPVQAIKDSIHKADAFAGAYTITSVFRYEMYEAPSAKQDYYLFVMRDYRGAFIVDKFYFKVYEKDKKVEVEDKETKNYLPAAQWLKKFKIKEAQKEKEEKKEK